MRLTIYLLSFLIFSGCASTVMKTHRIDSSYRSGNYEDVVDELNKKVSESSSNDKLMWQLNLALAYQAQGE